MADYIKELRARIGHMRIVIPGVRGILVDDQRRLLLQRRADTGHWGLPAGVVDVGDSVLDALSREVHEETGLTVERAELFGVYTDPRFTVTYPNGDEVQTFTVAFLVRAWSGQLSADSDEVVDVRFFPLDALPENLWPVHRETIDDYRNFNGVPIVK
jgi:ADP-ribose pyrophosphatase YjhB (NUDIX family)